MLAYDLSFAVAAVLLSMQVYAQCTADNGTQTGTADQTKNCTRNCGSEIRPVCGSDGNLYANKCRLKESRCRSCTKIKKIAWKNCDFETCRQTFCPMYCLQNRICGSDGILYCNECLMLRASCGRKEGPVKSVNPKKCPINPTDTTE